MASKKCKDVMSNPVHVCREGDSVEQAAKLMEKHNIGFVPVIDASKKVIGVVTDRDLATRVLAHKKSASAPIREFITREDLVTCRAGDELATAEQKMERSHRSRILVTDEEGRPQGVIGLTEIAHSEENGRAGRLLGSVKSRFVGTA
jgi:CBS domain-containing protein